MSDGKEAKYLLPDEFHSAQGGFYKMPNGLYAHYSCDTELDKQIAKLGKAKLRKVPSCTDVLKWWERIKEQDNAK